MADLAIEQLKTCARCKVPKPLEQFGYRKAKGWRRSPCNLCCAEVARASRAANPERAREMKRAWCAANRKKVKETRARRRQATLEQQREQDRERQRLRRSSDPMYRLRHSVSTHLRKCLKGSKASQRTKDMLGYTASDLKSHLERQFTNGMTWDNYGQWHIDHIQPVASFSFTTPDCPDFKACWALSNIRPLMAAENRAKSDSRQFLL